MWQGCHSNQVSRNSYRPLMRTRFLPRFSYFFGGGPFYFGGKCDDCREIECTSLAGRWGPSSNLRASSNLATILHATNCIILFLIITIIMKHRRRRSTPKHIDKIKMNNNLVPHGPQHRINEQQCINGGSTPTAPRCLHRGLSAKNLQL